jgi:hypothetical protein
MQLHGAKSGRGLVIRHQSVPRRRESEYVKAGGACCVRCNPVWI